MSVLAQATARGDVLLRRGVTTEWAVRWEQDAGDGFKPVDLSSWSGVCEFRSLFGDLLLTIPIHPSANGIAPVIVDAGLLTGDAWERHASGTWRVDVSHKSRTERLGDGYFYLEA